MIATTETKLPEPKEIATKFPKLNMPLPGPNAKRVVELDTKYVSPSYTRDYPLVAKRGRLLASFRKGRSS